MCGPGSSHLSRVRSRRPGLTSYCRTGSFLRLFPAVVLLPSPGHNSFICPMNVELEQEDAAGHYVQLMDG
ncbi:hypothetical protein Q5P01_025628 [Channa striata]|uniref:Uncharacterized protein n=1 Tax=Channa striata TaxID=64152 RepID=A0AA88IIW1_CHASR|nr:hypothetical protein Q5P01_025628 [Channa striata]